MKYIEFKRRLDGFAVFSLADVRAIDPGFYRRQLSEWQDHGYIKKISRGYYIFSDMKRNDKVIFELANRIYSPSYVSFEMALSYYGLIPESVYGVTSASTRRTYRFKTFIADFIYRTLKPSLFFGYQIIAYEGRSFKVAVPEKAILDYFYINKRIKTPDDFAALRCDRKALLKTINEKKMRSFLKIFDQKSLTVRVNAFWEFMKDA